MGTEWIPLEVRRALPSDVDIASRDGQLSREQVAALVESGRVYVATRGGERVGYARLEYLWSKIPYLALIFVLEEHRRRGVGRTLLAAIERDAGAEGHTWLYSSSQANEPQPQDWHRRMGFVECGFIAGINPGGVGEVFFRRPIGQPQRQEERCMADVRDA